MKVLKGFILAVSLMVALLVTSVANAQSPVPSGTPSRTVTPSVTPYVSVTPRTSATPAATAAPSGAQVIYAATMPCMKSGTDIPAPQPGLYPVITKYCINTDTGSVGIDYTALGEFYVRAGYVPRVSYVFWSSKGTPSGSMLTAYWVSISTLDGALQYFIDTSAVYEMKVMQSGFSTMVQRWVQGKISRTAFVDWLDKMTVYSLENAKNSKDLVTQTQWRSIAIRLQAVITTLP